MLSKAGEKSKNIRKKITSNDGWRPHSRDDTIDQNNFYKIGFKKKAVAGRFPFCLKYKVFWLQ